MRKYLTKIEIVGCVLVYQEGEQCRWSLDWLYANCDRVAIILDNWDEATKKIALEYKEKYPDRTHVAYCDEPINVERCKIQGQTKKRFKKKQAEIREFALKEVRKMHDEKPISMLIFSDSDETFIDEFYKYLEHFWSEESYDYMMLGCVEVFESMQIIMSQKMAPHGRIFKYNPGMTVYPWRGRTRYNPYYLEKRPWKVRNVIVHVCHLTEEYRKKRQFFDNANYEQRCERRLWFLPKDIIEMTAVEIADYQPGHRQAPSKYPSVALEDYLNNREHYNNKFNLKLWNQI